jgi:IS30 family transposase
MAEGVQVREACRRVGVSESTGKRWRHGRTVHKAGRVYRYAPLVGGRGPVISARYLSEDERTRIADGLLRGESIRVIAAALGRSASTVSREVRRNADAAGVYRPFAADRLATARRCRPRPGKLASDPELRQFVQDRLDTRWSPEQISQALRSRFPDDPRRRVVHETIYQALYVQGRGELRRELAGALRTGRARRKPRARPDARAPRSFVDPMVMISERPAEADDRAVPGHWEGDLILGAGTGPRSAP